MNAKGFIGIFIVVLISFLLGKYTSANLSRIEREAIEYNRETEQLGNETREIGKEIERLGLFIEYYEKGQMDIRSFGACTWDDSRGRFNPVDTKIKDGIVMREGISKYLLPLIGNTPAIIECMIIALLLFLVVDLIKKSYPVFFNKEIYKGVKVKHLTPIAITILGMIYYLAVCREKFGFALADGAVLALLGIVYDNSWNALKNSVKGLFSLLQKGFKKSN